MDKQALFVGIVVGLASGIFFEKFARARRDYIGAKKATSTIQSAYRWYFTPRFLIVGFVGVCATIAAFRAMFGVAE